MKNSKTPIEGLENAIHALYSTFARYRPTDIAWRSPHAGISDAQVARLQSRPLRELTLEDLEQYIRRALSVWGGVTEFKHFLPRIFELVMRHPLAIDPLVFEKLDGAEWLTWPTDEREAVEAYMTTLWRWLLTLGPEAAHAGDTLRGFGLAGCDLEPWLDFWRRENTPAATDQLAEFILAVSTSLESRSMPRRWHPKDHAVVLGFLLSPDTKSRVEAAFMERPDGESSRRLADAADVLSRVMH